MLENTVDDARLPGATVDAVKDFACGLHHQRGDLRALAVRGHRRDTGSDEEAYRFELAQLTH